MLVLVGTVCAAPVFAGAGVSVAPEPTAPPAPPVPPAPPADPAGLTVFTLDNGMQVWMHPVPVAGEPARVGIALVIRAGPLDEDDDQLGAAYLVKRASGLGTAHAPIDALDRLGAAFGRSWRPVKSAEGGHATLTHEGVVHTLVFGADDQDAWATALGHYADLFSGWTIDDATMDAVRRMASERVGDFTPEDRARRALLADLFVGERIGQRPLIPTPEELARTGDDAVRRFVREHYRADRSTLVVVGAFDVGDTLARVRDTLGGIRPAEPGGAGEPGGPRDQWGGHVQGRPAAITTSVGGRVAALTQPGYVPAEVALLSVTPAETTRPQDLHRRGVFDAVAAELVGARVRPAAALADAGVTSVETGVKGWIGGATIAEISVRVEQPGLPAAGLAVAGELARIKRHGFDTEELRVARASVLGGYEEAAHAWRGADAGRVMDELVSAARSRDPGGRNAGWVSPIERAGLASAVLASTTDDALAAHALGAFDPASLACVLIGSEPDPALEASDGRDILSVARGAAPAPFRAVPELLGEPASGTPGGLTTISNDPATGVWTGLLDNGVLVRVRRTPGASGVLVRVTLCDGPGREDAGTIGRTRDAVAAWAYPTIGPIDAGAVRAWSLQRGLSFRAEIDEHTVVLGIDAETPAGAADALTLAGALLARPGCDAAYADRMVAKAEDHGPALRRFTELMFRPGEPRARRAESAGPADPAAANAWLGTLARAPMEVAIVGDLAPEDALRMASRTLGTLARREPPSRSRPNPWGPVPRAETLERVASGPDGRGQALVGIVFGDATELGKVRPMLIAAGAINSELDRERREGRLDASARAWVWLGDGIPDRATLVVWCNRATDPEGALAAIDRAIERVANGSSDPAVIEQSLERARRSVERAWESPSFWADRLSRLSSQGLDIGSVAGMPGSYGSITVRAVRDTLQAAVGGGVHKRVIAVPGAE